ncbi:MAG: NAD(P)/FAD-dependent oxidoreductase [Paracoccaceae bacterium]|nr:NAD(P)/FAD-dependent oxidoreductase [Paracoccaceae bacterium]MDE2738853.1 NAD(P)/FAD-dependent oxidoreductase [Paracoccaceae bacterium]
MGKNHLDNIAIVGSGLAGLTLAIRLAQKGIVSTIYEKENKDNLGGMGIQITPNGSRILSKLGVEEPLREISSKVESVTALDGLKSKRLFSLDLNQFSKSDELGYFTCHRGKLIRILSDKAMDLGIRFCFGKKITPQCFSPYGVDFSSDKGEELHASLLIGADGYGSQISQILNPAGEKHKPDFVALRGLVPIEKLSETKFANGVNLYMYPAQHLVTYGIDMGKVLNVVAIRPFDHMVDTELDPETIKAGFQNFRFLESLLANATEIRTNLLYKGIVQPQWFTGKVCLCGDALHPMPPFLAQGGNMAIEDGWVLASSLYNNLNLTDALNWFKSKRQQRLERMVKYTNSQAWINHLQGGLMYQLRNTTMTLADRTLPNLISSRYSWIYKGM